MTGIELFFKSIHAILNAFFLENRKSGNVTWYKSYIRLILIKLNTLPDFVFIVLYKILHKF